MKDHLGRLRVLKFRGWSPDNDKYSSNIPSVGDSRSRLNVPGWSYNLQNVLFRRGEVSKREGDQEFLTDFSNDIELIDQFFLRDGTDQLVFCTNAIIAYYNTTTQAKVNLNTGLAGSSEFKWKGEFFLDGLFYLTNYGLGLYNWNGSAGSMTLRVTDPKGANLAAFEDHMFLCNTIEGGVANPQGIAWSDNANATDFSEGTIKSSGRLTLGDDSSWCLLFIRLGPFFFCFKERAIYNIQKLGGDFVFGRRIVVDGVGPLSAECVINLGDEVFFWGNDDFYAFDGVRLRAIGDADNRIKDFAFARLDPSYLNNMWAQYIEETTEIWWHFTSTASSNSKNDRAIIYNLDDDAFSYHTIDATAGGYYKQVNARLSDAITTASDEDTTISDAINFTANYPLNLIARPGGNIYSLGGSNQDGLGADIDAFMDIMFTPWEDGSVAIWTKLKLWFSRKLGSVNVDVQYLGLLTPLDTVSFSDTKKVTVSSGDTDTIEYPILETGRALAVRIRTSGTNTPWILTRMEAEYDPAGDV
jgi:hypothetical protein